MDASVCHYALTVMTTAGLYETSGDWLYDIGLPGKSGIGGGIVTVSPGKGGLGTIFVNGEKVAEGRIDRTEANIFSADEGADVGLDGETPVTDDYKERDNKFTGKIGKVTVDLK